MIEDVLPTKPNLPEGFLDTAVGEPYVIRDALLNNFAINLNDHILPYFDEGFWNYPSPAGYTPLVKLLEDKYQAPVIVTNGAKQGLSACLYALSKLGHSRFELKKPYWCLIPPLAEVNSIVPTYLPIEDKPSYSHSPYLMVAPNNPDGSILDSLSCKHLSEWYQEQEVPLIHDAAYYTPTYLPKGYQTQKIGDVQIFSSSKMLGLPALRVGFCVCHNPVFYDLIRKYIDHMTVGVSVVAQSFLYNILSDLDNFPSAWEAFEEQSHDALAESRRILSQVNPEFLEVPDGFENSAGMFAFLKMGAKADFEKAKVNISPGHLYGMPGYVRMNLAIPAEKMQEVVKRFNSVA